MDNETMVEVFKYLTYHQLAENNLVSKRFSNLIRAHRHKLALLFVVTIKMNSYEINSASIKIFEKQLSPKAYNDWMIRIASMQDTQNVVYGYDMALAYYKDRDDREWKDETTVLNELVELNNENLPVFQHFSRLFTDPLIYIDHITLTSHNDVLNLLSDSFNSVNRLQCKQLVVYLENDSQKFINWIQNHVRCKNIFINGEADLNQDVVLLDFFMTGAHCTPSIEVMYCDLSIEVVDFVQKFLNLGNGDEYQGVQSIEGWQYVEDHDIQVLKNDYAKFIVKEEHDDDDDEHGSTKYFFEFVNNAIGKELKLTATIYDNTDCPEFSLKIKNL
ncbi:hypothetical protein Ddc_11078 [Ditylenchus destructor]|nr:hypothetical protein Ddc_11078 [Ditylenchus destructor]